MPPSYVQARTVCVPSTATSAMRAVRSISTIFGSGLRSWASGSLSPRSQSAGASDAASAATPTLATNRKANEIGARRCLPIKMYLEYMFKVESATVGDT